MKPSRAAKAVSLLVDLMGLSGCGLIAYGTWLVFVPAGYIVGGTILVTIAWLCSRVSPPPAPGDA
jgi:TRAP-type C4-dicarboxylate transport system permease small subunit